VLGRKPLHRSGFTRAPQDRLQHAAGEQPVIVGLELVGERVGDPEEAGHRIDLDGQRRGAQRHGVAAGLMRMHDRSHRRKHARGDPVGDTFVPDLLRHSYAANLRPEVLQRTVLSILESPTLRSKIKLSLIENLHYFPRHLLIAVATQVNRMPFDNDHAFLKRELQLALQLNDHMRKHGSTARIARR